MTKLHEINLELILKIRLSPLKFAILSLVLCFVLKCLKSDNASTYLQKQMVTYADHTYQEYLYK